MSNYIEKLKKRMLQQELPNDYIEECISYATKLLNKGLPVIFDSEHFAKLVGINYEDLRKLTISDNYKEVKIPKKNGIRTLLIPNQDLMFVQKWMLVNLISKVKISKHSRGFIKNTSLVDNAKHHVKKEYVITLDIKNFFSSIHNVVVYRIFRSLGYTKELSGLFTKLLVTKDGLPQGAPTSPYLSHIVCKKLDRKIFIELKSLKNCDFTRYADDITISGEYDITEKIENIIGIIESLGFEINLKKKRHQLRSQQQMVTGLVVNDKVNIPKSYIRKLKQEIYYCKKYGVNSHMNKTNINNSNYKLFLFGKAYYIKMINKDLGEKFLKELDEIDWPY
ncbi:reverse transcriptase family protein [Planococcus glaciei]|uniref:reverse transcriptase family protein n=1 Tax=Planococcus glaciei TaxID=459472 RepID=UPI001C72BC45|nr:reverse transcriptase family protein [Planococcus glaciei]MBX0315490.1 reverse transcriptase family protein [Planococcus glaciei]